MENLIDVRPVLNRGRFRHWELCLVLPLLFGCQYTKDDLGKLQDERDQVRIAAAHNLGRVGERSSVRALVQALKHNDLGTRLAVIDALGTIADSQALPSLFQVIQNEKRKPILIAACTALGEIADSAASQPLSLLFIRSSKPLRALIAETLAETGGKAALSALMNAISDPSEAVRWVSVRSLRRLGHPETPISSILSLLSDSSERVRRSAFASLGKIDPDWRNQNDTRSFIRRLRSNIFDPELTYEDRCLNASTLDVVQPDWQNFPEFKSTLTDALHSFYPTTREAGAEVASLNNSQIHS